VAAPRDAVLRWTAPWLAAPWRMAVVEPAATALLRAAGGDTTEVFVRTGAGMLGFVVGNRTRWVLSRTVELDWEADLGRARVEVGDTMDMARKAGGDPTGLVIGGTGQTGLLVDALAGIGTTRSLRLSEASDEAAIPSEAIVAVGMARWATGTRASSQQKQGGVAARLSELLRRRSRNAA